MEEQISQSTISFLRQRIQLVICQNFVNRIDFLSKNFELDNFRLLSSESTCIVSINILIDMRENYLNTRVFVVQAWNLASEIISNINLSN